ncbi:MAG: motility associated factor glycosyltransferase family protein [Parachlamydiales bacterium]|nr:motility associated factor glycosyltransferase family protein [Parachlamydiales bacterium]
MQQLNENLDILSEKNPYLFMLLNTYVSKTKKTSIFKFFEKDIFLENVDFLFVYKPHQNISFKMFEKWLDNDEKALIFFEDDLDHLLNFFKSKNAFDFLKRDNVFFHFFNDADSFLNELSSKYFSHEIDVITFQIEDEKFLSLKDQILKKMKISFLSHHDSFFSNKIFKNFYSNIDQLSKSFYANKLKNKFKNVPAIVCGAGPSLKYSYEKIKKLENSALIIAGGSAIKCLTLNNINPHLGVIIDPNLEEFNILKNSLAYEMPIIYSTRVNSGVFNTFNGPIGYIKAFIGGMFEIFIDEKFKLPFEYVGKELSETSLSVTSVCISYAKYLGCNPIILDGLDLSYSDNKKYATDSFDDKKIDNNNKLIPAKSKDNKNIFTNHIFQIEKKCISDISKKLKNQKIYNATQSGLQIDNILDVSYEEILKKSKNFKEFDLKGYLHSLIQDSMLKIKDEDIEKLKKDIFESFKKSKEFLKIIISKNPEYKKILAEEDLKEEIAFKYFLFDLFYILEKRYDDSMKKFQKLFEAIDYFCVD